mmetsp:Transcript_64186/g.170626  ORF Transcript_64186/g.170626 Transcript_64186/m.170626 type:complete len:220 (+) Transcript_64186:395-1054(+)
MRASELVSEVKSSRRSRISSDGITRCAAARDLASSASSCQQWLRTSGKGLPTRAFSTSGTRLCSARRQRAVSGEASSPPLAGAGGGGGRPRSASAQAAMAPLLTSFCGAATWDSTSCTSSGQPSQKARPAWCDAALAQALSATRRSPGSRSPSIAATTCGNGASLVDSSTPAASGERSSTKPRRRTTQRRTELSHVGSTSSWARCCGTPSWLRSTWPLG